jgi:hypothetical protein
MSRCLVAESNPLRHPGAEPAPAEAGAGINDKHQHRDCGSLSWMPTSVGMTLLGNCADLPSHRHPGEGRDPAKPETRMDGRLRGHDENLGSPRPGAKKVLGQNPRTTRPAWRENQFFAGATIANFVGAVTLSLGLLTG